MLIAEERERESKEGVASASSLKPGIVYLLLVSSLHSPKPLSCCCTLFPYFTCVCCIPYSGIKFLIAMSNVGYAHVLVVPCQTGEKAKMPSWKYIDLKSEGW